MGKQRIGTLEFGGQRVDTVGRSNYMDRCGSATLATTVDQWREALSACEKPKYPEGKTLAELARILGKNRSTLTGQLKHLIAQGRCKYYEDIRNNRMTTVYILEK